MRKIFFVLTLSLFPCLATAVTVTSRFVITNHTIESSDISSTDASATWTDAGNGLYRISDNYQDANINASSYGNQQLSLQRLYSTINIIMKGEKLGHTFIVQGKYANSSISVSPYTNSFFSTAANRGCSNVSPVSALGDGTQTVEFIISSDSDVSKNCVGKTADYEFKKVGGVISVIGLNRDFYLDVGRLQRDPEYRKAPPDTYRGSGVFRGEIIKPRVGGGFTPSYINNVTILKNPYFEGVALPPGDNVFDTRTIGGKIQGNLVIPYVINGHFTPYNSILLQVSSANGFRLQSGNNTIPYSLGTTIGSQRTYQLAKDGFGSGAVTINDLELENYAIQGRFNADFLIDKNVAMTGDYSDMLTALFQVAL